MIVCIECGVELDEHDVTANVNTWGVFRQVCSDHVELHDARINPQNHK